MTQSPQEDSRETNPYASPSNGSRSADSDWPTLLDLLEAAVVLCFVDAAIMALLFLLEHDFFYFALYFGPAVPAGLAAHRFRQRHLRKAATGFAWTISLELTALSAFVNYFAAAKWSMTGHPLIELIVGGIVTFSICLVAQQSEHFWNLPR